MSIPDKETVALDEEELSILDAIRRAAPKHHINPKLAQTYGVWTVCFRRYCLEKSIPWLWMSSVSDFMDFLDAHPNVSAGERNRALDGIMFYITDVHKRRQEEDDEDEDERNSSSVPRSTQSLFARMLLRCDVDITEALHLRREDVHLKEATITFSGDDERKSRTVDVPSTLHEGLKHHVERVQDRTTSSNPLLFGSHGRRDSSDSTGDSSTDEELDRSTELATRVMKTFGKEEEEESGTE